MKQILFFLLISFFAFSNGVAQNDTIVLKPLKKQGYQVKIGQKLTFQAKVHGSVGIDATQSISDEKIVQLLSQELKFKNESEEILPGGDEAVRYFVFEAKQKGKATIQIEEVFRGQVKKTYIFKIQVQ